MKKLCYPLRSLVTVSGALVLASVSLLLTPAWAQVRPTHRPNVPAFDKRAQPTTKAQRASERERGTAYLSSQLPTAAVDFDPLLDTPKFIRAHDGFLTGPNGQGRGVNSETAKALAVDDPIRPIKGFLNEHHELFGHGAEVLQGAHVKRDYVDAHNGLHTIVWEQQLDGIPVYRSVLMGHITRQGELASLCSAFLPNLAASADVGTPGRSGFLKAPPISAQQAVALAVRNLGMTLADSEVTAAKGSAVEGSYQVYQTPEQAYVRQVWLPLHRASLRLGWETIVTQHDTKERFRMVVDSQTGEVWTRDSLTQYISDATYNVYDSDSPSPFTPGLQTPGTTQPPLTSRVLIVTPALDTNASPAGWIPDGGNTTTGNNVDAFVDRDFNQQPDQARPTGNPNRVFDFTLDLNQEPKSYIDASTVELFWRANWYHDRLYQLGFTEAAGNFQANNFGRGGFGGDNVIAYVQAGADAGIANNSMFSTPPDGMSGECYMFVFTGPTPDRDGSLDEEVVCHEMTHGTSWRLVGGGMALGNLQGDGMGEGWSDFYALCLLGAPGDDPNAAYPTGGYASYNFYGLTQNYYFGIRHFPYCTDMSRNPFTFKDIDPAQISPHAGVPRSPLYPFDPTEADEVHHQGEVWCATLWGVHANLVTKHGWTVGNEMALQLATDGMKLTPPSPNFLQARDAILLADRIDNGGANQVEIWSGFAKRGMGFSATSPAGTTTAGVHEAYDLPGLFVDHVVVSGGNGNGVIDNNECDDLTIYLGNDIGYQVTGVIARLSCATPGVIVVQPVASYAPIPEGATNGNLSPFRISVASDFVCGLPLDCTMVVKSDQITITNRFTIYTGIPGTPLRFDNSTPTPIPDLGETNSVIVVSNVTAALSKVTASIYITHTYDLDLMLQLISPDGTTNVLSASNGSYGHNYGAACSPDDQRTTFDDAATQTIGAGTAPFVGTYQPQTPLSVFIGKAGTNVNGTWRLRAVDQYGGDVGTIQCWSLFLAPAQCKDGGGECPGADLALGMGSTPEPVLVGSPLTYTISITNNGPSSARNIIVTHLLPTGVIFVSATASQGSCSQAGGVVTASLGTLAYGGRATVSVAILPAVTGTLSSTASVTSDQSDPDPSNNSATVISHVNPIMSDLAVGLAAQPNPLVLGGTLTYTISITNNGPSTASGVTVTNILPSGASVLSASVSQGSITPGAGLWTLGILTSGSKATATVMVVPSVEGTATAQSTVAGNQFDPIQVNNVAAITTVVGPAADLSIGIADFPDPAIVLSNVIYVFSVTNSGPSSATSVAVSGNLPDGVVLLSTNASQGAVSVAGRAVTWVLGTMGRNSKATLTFVVQTTVSGTLTTTATIAGAEPDPNPFNNSATATTQVAPAGTAIAAAGATLTAESFTPPNGAIDIGETVTVILRLRNSSNVSALNLVGTLIATPGVTPVAPNNPQTYGVLAPSGFPVGRSFSFTATGTNGQTISPTLQLNDGTNVYPPVSFNFTLPNIRTYVSTNTIVIPDPAAPYPLYAHQSGPALPYPSAITVSNLSGVLGRVTVTLSNLSHSFPSDVNALLVAPNGAAKCLFLSHAGTVLGTNLNLSFDDSAASPLPDSGPLASGTWQPSAYGSAPSFPASAPAGPYATALSACNAANPNGTWSLCVFDDVGGDQGSILNGWSLTLSMVTPVNQLADLNLTVADAPDPAQAGEVLTYTFTVVNNGPNVATSVGFTNALPAGVNLLSATPSQGLLITNANTVVANLGTLNTGAVATVTVVAMPTPAAIPSGNSANVTNIASVGSSETDPNPGNNAAAAVTLVKRPLADVGVTLNVAPDPAVVGFFFTNTIVVTNYGPSNALAVAVTDPLPVGTAFVSATSTVGTCTNSSGTVVCSLGDLPSGAVATVTIVLTPTIRSDITNSVFATTASQDTNLGNNVATWVVTVKGPAAQIIGAGALMTYESGPANGLVDPNETVSLNFKMANVGSLDTVNLKATLLAANGVTAPSGAQYYGALLQNGPAVARSFTFKAAADITSGPTATFQLRDERATVTNDLGTITFVFNQPASTAWSNAAAILIPDHGAAAPYPSTIAVSGLTGVVVKASVTLNGLTHSFPHDVNALLVCPTGGNVLLMSHTGGGHSATNLTLTFDDAVTNALPASDALASGTNLPSSYPASVAFPSPAATGPYGTKLATLAGRGPNGAWSLYIFDDANGDNGYVANGWTLNLKTAATVGPVNDLVAGMTTAPAYVYSGGLLTNTVSVTNFGPDAATGVTLSSPLSAGVRFVSVSLSQGTLVSTNGGQVICNLGSLADGGTARAIIVVSPTVVETLTNLATIAASEEDLNPANNSAQTLTTVIKANTATALASSVNPSLFGQAVTFSANVTAVLPGTGTPTGTVQFKTNGVSFGDPVALFGGSANSAPVASLAVGNYTVTAQYSGDSTFNTNSATLIGGQVVSRSSSATAVGSSVNPSAFGQAVTFSATVTAVAPGVGTPSGTVQFKVNGANFGAPVALSGGSASSASLATLPVGSYTVTAVYSGDGSFNASTGTLLGGQGVLKANTTTTVGSSVNPSVFGQGVTFGATVAAVLPGTGIPTGSVQFKVNGANYGAPVALSGGSASSASLASLAAGGYVITADYLGDGGFNISSGTLPAGQTVNRASSSVAVAASVNPSVYGQPVTFTATLTAVAPGAGTPGGTVQFKTNGVNFGSAVTLAGGSASSAALASLAVGSYTVTAEYSGDSSFNISSGTLATGQVVNQANSATAIASSANPSVYGQPVTFTATLTAVAPGAGTPSGTVQFKTNGVNFGAAVTLSGGSASSAAISSLAVANYAVTAEYSGDGSFNTSSGTLVGGQTVNKANSATALASSVNPSVFGQAVTFTATLTAVAPGAGTPSGSVQFKTNGVNFGSAVTLASGSASSAALSALVVGNCAVTADYSGDGSFNTSSGTLAGGQVVNKANSATTVSSSVNPSTYGQAVTFSATVTAVLPGVGTPGGTVQFKTNGVNFGAAVALVSGSASSAAISTLAAGGCAVTVDYSGDSSFNTSSGTLAGGQTINKANSSTAVASSLSPSVFGQSVTFTATLTAVAPGAGTPGGTVQFKTNGVNLGSPVALSGGSATVTTSTLSVGSYAVTADYSGDASFNTSSGTLAGGQTVNQANSSTAVAASVNPSVFGQSVTFTAALTAVAPGAGTPSGSVQFKTNGVNLGSAVALASGSATLTISTLVVGTYTVTADYSGDTSFNTSSGTLAGGQTVNKANSLTAVASSANPATLGAPVTFTATLTAVAPGAGTPSGTVQFKTNGVDFGSAVALTAGTASQTLSNLATGNYTVAAEYSGDASFNASTNTLAGGQTVNPAVPARLVGAMVAGKFQLTVTAQPGATYVVQGSPNFVAWLPLSTNTVPAGGTFIYTETNSPAPQDRFYRTWQQAP
jgi:large repetitive protein